MIEIEKIIYELREKVKKYYPDYSEKEVSAFVAGMIQGFRLSRINNED